MSLEKIAKKGKSLVGSLALAGYMALASSAGLGGCGDGKECEDFDRRCNGNAVERCVMGEWKHREDCEWGCEDGRCKGEPQEEINYMEFCARVDCEDEGELGYSYRSMEFRFYNQETRELLSDDGIFWEERVIFDSFANDRTTYRIEIGFPTKGHPFERDSWECVYVKEDINYYTHPELFQERCFGADRETLDLETLYIGQSCHPEDYEGIQGCWTEHWLPEDW